MTIVARIRREAAAKIQVRITKRVRSRSGFDITFSKVKDQTGTGGGYRKQAQTRREALQHLLAVLRCMSPIEISVTPSRNRR